MPALKTRTVPAVYNALNILEQLASASVGLSLADLVEQSNLAKSSVHYLLVTLERCGYVHRSERTGRYMLGVKLFSMGNMAIGSLGLRQRATSYLSGLRMRTHLTTHMAFLEGSEAVLVVRQEAQNGMRLASWIGKRMDMHCTGIGKAILAHLPQNEIEAIIQKHGLARHNENTISSVRRLHEELEHIVKMGYAFDNEEDELGVRCLGVPIFGPVGRPLAAISVAGSTEQIPLDQVPRLANELFEVAKMMNRAVVESLLPIAGAFRQESGFQKSASELPNLALDSEPLSKPRGVERGEQGPPILCT
jgi:DNA-binding IclR family transcriptional regulator